MGNTSVAYDRFERACRAALAERDAAVAAAGRDDAAVAAAVARYNETVTEAERLYHAELRGDV